MCLMIFIRISAVTLCRRRKMPCNFSEIILKAKIFHIVAPIDKILFHNFVLAFAIAEYHGLNKKKHIKKGGLKNKKKKKNKKNKKHER